MVVISKSDWMIVFLSYASMCRERDVQISLECFPCSCTVFDWTEKYFLCFESVCLYLKVLGGIYLKGFWNWELEIVEEERKKYIYTYTTISMHENVVGNLFIWFWISTEQAIHNFVSRIYLSMDRGEYYMGVFVDLCKMLDSLDRGLVLRKLHHFGLRGTLLEWYRPCFSDRRQKA